MSNSFYSHGSYPATNASGTSAAMRAELDLITAGFDKMPALSTNASKAIVVNGGGTALTATVGSLALAGDFSTLGAYSVALTMTASTTLTLPTTGTLATLAGSETLTTKTINLSSNTLTGTITQFNTACSDADFATIAGSEALSNKTLTAPIFSGSITGTYTLAGTPTITSPTISNPVLSGSATGTYTLAGTPTIAAPTFSGAASGSLSGLALTSAVLTTSTVAADPVTALGIAPKQYVDAVAFGTGDVKLTFKTTADTSWVLMDDTTIGDASSSATGRANADTSALFTLLWTNIVDQWAPVSSGRGGSAAADFAAHKTIALPKTLGRALAGYGTGTVVASGVDSDVDITANDLTVASNNTKWITGMLVTFTLTSGTVSGLTSGNPYYVIRSSATKIQLASSLTNAQNGTASDYTAKSSPVWTITHTYTARVLGEAVGEQSHAMSSTESLAHTHTVSAAADTIGSGTSLASPYDAAPDGAHPTTSSFGGNAAMNITDPTLYLNVMVKL